MLVKSYPNPVPESIWADPLAIVLAYLLAVVVIRTVFKRPPK